jgi:EmrB/QacA subfamily drug resistance transporter
MSGRFIAALALSIAVVPLNSTMIAVAIPVIGKEISEPAPVLAQWLVTSYLLVNIVVQSPAGKLGDLFGHTRALNVGRSLFAIGSVVGFFSRALPLLVVARVLMAMGGAVIAPAATALLRNGLPKEQRARAFGAFGAVMGLAAAMGPLIGGEIVTRFGWSWLFLINAPLLVLSALLTYSLPAVPRANASIARPRFDLLGSVLLGAGLSLLVLATRLPGKTAVYAGVGVAFAVLFVLWERVASDPVVDFGLFKRRIFAAGTLLVMLQNLAMYALLFSLPITLSQAFASTPGQTGRCMLAMTGAMVLCSPLGGRVSERLGPRGAALLGSGMSLTGMIFLAAFTPTQPLDVIPGLVLLGGGLGMGGPAAQSSAMSDVPAEKSGMAAGISSTARYLGGVAGVALMSALAIGGDPIAQHQRSAVMFALALLLSMGCAAMFEGKVGVEEKRG